MLSHIKSQPHILSCFSVCVDNNGTPGKAWEHSSCERHQVDGYKVDVRGAGPMVGSAGPGSVHHPSRLGLIAQQLVETPDALENCCVNTWLRLGPTLLCPHDVIHIMNVPRPSLLFAALWLLCRGKLENEKLGMWLATTLMVSA